MVAKIILVCVAIFGSRNDMFTKTVSIATKKQTSPLKHCFFKFVLCIDDTRLDDPVKTLASSWKSKKSKIKDYDDELK